MFFSKKEESSILKAIQNAELQTSGEIKVHIEKHCSTEDPMERAKEVFFQLKLNKTELSNGVLFYLAFSDKKFAILGDKGIDKVAELNFWENEKQLLYTYLHRGESCEGLCLAIEKAGEALRDHFPYQDDDENELSDEISIG